MWRREQPARISTHQQLVNPGQTCICGADCAPAHHLWSVPLEHGDAPSPFIALNKLPP